MMAAVEMVKTIEEVRDKRVKQDGVCLRVIRCFGL